MIYDAETLNKAVSALIYLINKSPGVKALKGFPTQAFDALPHSQSLVDLDEIELDKAEISYFALIGYLAQCTFREEIFVLVIRLMEESDEMIFVVHDFLQDPSLDIDPKESKLGDKTIHQLMQETMLRATAPADPVPVHAPSNDYNDREKYSDEALYPILKEMDMESYKTLPDTLKPRLIEIEKKYPLWQDFLLRDFLVKNDRLTNPQAKQLYVGLHKTFPIRSDVLNIVNFVKNMFFYKNHSLRQCSAFTRNYSQWIDGGFFTIGENSAPAVLLKTEAWQHGLHPFRPLRDLSKDYSLMIQELFHHHALIRELRTHENRLAVLDQILRKVTQGMNKKDKPYLDMLLLEAVSTTGETEMLQLLLAYGASPKKHEFDTPLTNAIQSGHIDPVKLLLKYGAYINETDYHGRTALFSAAQEGNAVMVQFLLNQGAKVDLPSKDGRTALYQAVVNNCKDVVEILLKAGADMNHQENRDGLTPLMHAVSRPTNECVALLVGAGARLDLKSHKGKKAIDYAENCPEHKRILQSAMTTAPLRPSTSSSSASGAAATNVAETPKKPFWKRK